MAPLAWILAGVIYTGFSPLWAADPLCRNDERCFGLGVTAASKPDLQYSVGSWPLPRNAKMRAAVGEKLHFEWDSRNEYADGQKWIKGSAGLKTTWELADGAPDSKDPCTGEAQGPWKAQTPAGSYDETLKECALGHTFRIKVQGASLKPKPPEAVLEITVVK